MAAMIIIMVIAYARFEDMALTSFIMLEWEIILNFSHFD